MSADSLSMDARATGPQASRRGRVPWARWVLIMIGLAAVAGAGWVGYQQQLAAESPAAEATVGVAAARPAASAPAGRASDAIAPRPWRAGPPQRAAASAATSASQPELRWPLWDFQLRQPIPPRDPPLTPPAWRLIGATLSSDGWKVVILRQGNATPEYFGVGAVLPGGYKIQAITDEDVTFDINKREVILSYTGSR